MARTLGSLHTQLHRYLLDTQQPHKGTCVRNQLMGTCMYMYVCMRTVSAFGRPLATPFVVAHAVTQVMVDTVRQLEDKGRSFELMAGTLRSSLAPARDHGYAARRFRLVPQTVLRRTAPPHQGKHARQS